MTHQEPNPALLMTLQPSKASKTRSSCTAELLQHELHPDTHIRCHPNKEQQQIFNYLVNAALQVIRVSLNALNNLLITPGLDDIGADLVEAGLPKVVAQRKQQVWTRQMHLERDELLLIQCNAILNDQDMQCRKATVP